MGGRDSSVGIATRYGLDGPGIESRWSEFFASVHIGPGAHPASYTMGTGSFPGVKRPGRGVDHPSPSSVVVEGRVQLYLFSLCWSSWPVLGWIIALHLQSAKSDIGVSYHKVYKMHGRTDTTILIDFLLPSVVSQLLHSEFLKSRTVHVWCQNQTAETWFYFFVLNVVTQLLNALKSDEPFHPFITPDVIRLRTVHTVVCAAIEYGSIYRRFGWT